MKTNHWKTYGTTKASLHKH